jgi:four helix bundle protein
VNVVQEIEEVKEVQAVKESEKEDRSRRLVKRYTDLLVYQQSYRSALQVSKFTRGLPREEQFGLAGSYGAVRDLTANVFEAGRSKTQRRILRRHLVIAAGEPAECGFWIGLAVDERFIPLQCGPAHSGGLRQARLYDANFGRSGRSCR